MTTKIIAQFVYYLIRMLNFTYRYEFVGRENKDIAKTNSPYKTFVYATWHQNLIGGIFSHIGEKFTMVISGSKDGELVSVTCEKFGHMPARGSSTRGGKNAMLEIVKFMKMGYPGAITVDGPKGPPHIVKPGVIEIARLCQCAILPLSPYPKNFWVIKKSWDQFRIPKPFSKIVVAIGEPIYIPENITREQFDDISKIVADKISKGEEIAKKRLYNSTL